MRLTNTYTALTLEARERSQQQNSHTSFDTYQPWVWTAPPPRALHLPWASCRKQARNQPHPPRPQQSKAHSLLVRSIRRPARRRPSASATRLSHSPCPARCRSNVRHMECGGSPPLSLRRLAAAAPTPASTAHPPPRHPEIATTQHPPSSFEKPKAMLRI
jgi:hypothetical protein